MSWPTDVTVSPEGLVEVRAYGGSRTSRGNKIGNAIRRLRLPGNLECYHKSYDEGHGFMSMSVAKYRVAVAKTAAVE